MSKRMFWEITIMSDVDKRAYKRRKARDSLKESEGLTPRIIRCPECDHRIMLAFDDCKGHATLYCNKCHEYRTINFKYFRLGPKKGFKKLYPVPPVAGR